MNGGGTLAIEVKMIISKTPLRISLLGGGTDFRDYYRDDYGVVVSCAIDKYIYVIVKERFDDLLVLNYSRRETVSDVQDIKHDIIRECLRMVGISKSIEITTLADIPSSGSGLGSSSSVAVGVLNALYSYCGQYLSSEDLARKACQIEIDIMGKPIGKQDQYIAAYGGIRKILFKADETVDVYAFAYNDDQRRNLGSKLLLHYTNVTRSADTILSDQKGNINTRRQELDGIRRLAEECELALEKYDYGKVGSLLRHNWELKKTLAGQISSPEIEKMVSLAMDNGSTGCKIAGAGGGGFLLSYVPRPEQDRYRTAMKEYRELPFMIDPFGSRIVFNIG